MVHGIEGEPDVLASDDGVQALPVGVEVEHGLHEGDVGGRAVFAEAIDVGVEVLHGIP